MSCMQRLAFASVSYLGDVLTREITAYQIVVAEICLLAPNDCVRLVLGLITLAGPLCKTGGNVQSESAKKTWKGSRAPGWLTSGSAVVCR